MQITVFDQNDAIFVDAGNTSLKFYRGLELVIQLPAASDLESGLSQLHDLRPRAIVLSSVQSRGDELIASWARECGATLLRIGDDIPLTLQSRYVEPSSLGIDRQLMSLAFIDGWGERGTIISLGTAITIDSIESGRHCGGHIAPGLETLAAALAQNTGALPLVDLRIESADGASTEGAINRGCRAMYFSYLDAQLAMAKENGRVVISGGAGREYARTRDVEYCDNLVARGMCLAYQQYKEEYV